VLPSPSPFLLGFYGTRADTDTVSMLKETGAAGVLLLTRNLRSPDQVRRLTQDLTDKLGRPLIFSVDHEGGWVGRFRDQLTAFPGNAALAKSGRTAWARECGRTMARELASMGIRLNLAPVADVQGTRYNPGIGIRSFGSDPKKVSKYCAEIICGHFDHNVATCIKHFPGKGDAKVDAHISKPTIWSSKDRMNSVHIAAFRDAIRLGIPSLMTTHAAYPALDPSGNTATYSAAISTGILRNRLNFRGLLISDDLGMGAVLRHQNIPEASVRCLAAGHDILILAEPALKPAQAASAISAALDSGKLDPLQWRKSRKRIIAFMDRFAKPAAGRLPAPESRLPRLIARCAVEILQQGRLRLPLREKHIDVRLPDFPALDGRFAFEDGPAGPGRRIKSRLSLSGTRLRYNTAAEENPDATAVFYCFDALRFPEERKDLMRWQAVRKKILVVLLRNPWDKTLLKAGTTALTAHGFRHCQLDALSERIL
jgi:beta-N-acetylhexosaminidase